MNASDELKQKPWLRHYSSGTPQTLALPTRSTVDQFRAIASRSPNAPAIYYFDTIITFEAIDRLSNALAAYFRNIGINRGDRIALYMQNIPQFWIASVAVWKIGAVIVPLNIMFKQRELLYHLNDSGATALVCMESAYLDEAQPIIKETTVQHVVTTSELDMLDQVERPAILTDSKKQNSQDTPDLLALCREYEGASDPDVSVALEDVAMLVYTSGTTGPPKGAMITFKNVAFNAEVYNAWMHLNPEDVIVGTSPLFHITGLIAQLATAIHSGLPLILAYRFDAGETLRLIEKWQGSFGVMAITAYMALLNHPNIATRNIKSLQKAYSGGAPIPQAIITKFKEKTGAYIYGAYGLTETTSPTHLVPYGQETRQNDEFQVPSVGIPVQNCECRVVDTASGETLPQGEIGEIAVKGPMIVDGYWQNPEETANAFRDDGFFLTGDVGLMDEAGWFYIIDRTKDMIIASGFKVWPREVEDVLYQHPAVREAAVVGIKDTYRGETVKAFIALNEGMRTEPKEIISFCKERLAAYKYPRELEIIDEIPKTVTGKFLRRALKDR